MNSNTGNYTSTHICLFDSSGVVGLHQCPSLPLPFPLLKSVNVWIEVSRTDRREFCHSPQIGQESRRGRCQEPTIQEDGRTPLCDQLNQTDACGDRNLSAVL